MSALKLSVTACTYVRTATTAKTKWTSFHHNHHHGGRGRRITPYTHSLPHSKINDNNNTVGFSRKPVCLWCPNKAGFYYACSSASPSRHGLVTQFDSDTKDHNNQPESQPEPQPESESEPSKLLTLPTILTLARVAAVPLLVATFYMDGWRGTTATTSIFIAAAVTDWLDGYIARKMKLKSSFGAFLDPVADKLMVAATLVLLCTRPLDVAVFGHAPWLLTVPSIAIIGREITMSAVREWAASQDSKLLEAVAVNNLGKWKTATQMTALTILLATRDWSHGGAAIVVGSGVALLYTSAGLALWSLVVYMRKISKVLLR